MLADLHIHSEYSRTTFPYRYGKLLKPLKYFLKDFKSPKVEDIDDAFREIRMRKTKTYGRDVSNLMFLRSLCSQNFGT